MTPQTCSECDEGFFGSGRWCSPACEEESNKRLAIEVKKGFEASHVVGVPLPKFENLTIRKSFAEVERDYKPRRRLQPRVLWKFCKCGQKFSTSKNNQKYCTPECVRKEARRASLEWWHKNRGKSGVCRTCGGPTAHKTHVFCQGCEPSLSASSPLCQT